MTILKSFTIKDLENVQPGELLVVDVGGRALAIAMNQDRDLMRMHLLLLTSPFDAVHPCWMTGQMTDTAVSYGSDWVLELGSDQVSPGSYEGLDKPGTILVSKQATLIRAGGDGKHIRPTHFDLESFTEVTRGVSVGDTVCVQEWRIWLNEADRTRIGARPIFEYKVPAVFHAHFG